MPQPVTTTELLLREVADLLIEVRDLLRERPAPTESADTEPIREPAAAAPSTGKPRARATKKT